MVGAAAAVHNVDHGKKFDVVPAVEGTGLADVIPARGAASEISSTTAR